MNTKNLTTFPQTEAIPSLEIHPSVSPKSAELLLKVCDAIAKDPGSYNQNHVNIDDDCGTPCCIDGHLRRVLDEKIMGKTYSYTTSGLNFDQWMSLFWTDRWPGAFKNLAEPTAAEGIARIEHFLRTGE